MEKATPPGVPHLGLYLSDLVMLDEGNPDFVKGNLINWAKRSLAASIIQKVQAFQQKRFNISVIVQINEWLKDISTFSDEQLFHLSQSLEPPPPI